MTRTRSFTIWIAGGAQNGLRHLETTPFRLWISPPRADFEFETAGDSDRDGIGPAHVNGPGTRHVSRFAECALTARGKRAGPVIFESYDQFADNVEFGVLFGLAAVTGQRFPSRHYDTELP